MNIYRLSGDNYNSIELYVSNSLNKIVTQQFYSNNGVVVKVDMFVFDLVLKDGVMSVKSIKSTSTDTIIIPGGWIEQILPDAMMGLKCRRVVTAANLKAKLCQHALYGNPWLKEYKALSRELKYDSDVFPETITRREV